MRNTRRAFIVRRSGLEELDADLWRDPHTGGPRFQIHDGQTHRLVRMYPHRLPQGEVVAVYALTAEDVVAAVQVGKPAT